MVINSGFPTLSLDQLTTIELGFFTRSNRPAEPLACPARFERATYALEAGKMSRNNKLDNSISLARSGVQYAPRILESGGIDCLACGIRRCGVG